MTKRTTKVDHLTIGLDIESVLT